MRSKQEWLEDLCGVLQEAIPSAGRPRGEAAEGGPDLALRAGERRLLVELKLVRGPRIPEVEGQLARASLRLRAHAGDQDVLTIAVVGLSSFGSKLLNAIRSFMDEFAPGVGWGLMGECGRAVFRIPGLDLEWEREASLPEPRRRKAERGDRQLFTDLNRWMLKVLLLENASNEFWGGPRQRPRHPTGLAKIALVSVAKAHNFAAAFEVKGFLRRSRHGLKLVRVQELLQSWLQSERNGFPKAVPVRALVPPLSREEPVLPPPAGEVAVLGGAFAALHRGLLRVGGHQLPLVHVRIPIGRAIQDWQLEECEPRDAEIVLSRPLFPQSVFRGRVLRSNQLPLVDLWQIALDSISGTARGNEQAQYILERVLALQEIE